MIKIIINAISAKSYAGGAFQIAYNFMLQCLSTKDPEIEMYYFSSTDLDEKIGENFNSLKDKYYFVFPTQPDFLHTYFTVKKDLKRLENLIRPDLIYTITAPCYFSFETKEVLRYTNPWVTHPNKYAWSKLSPYESIRTFFYCMNQKRLLRKASYFITQTEYTKLGIQKITNLPLNNIFVVSNVLPRTFTKCNTSHINNQHGDIIDIVTVAAPFPHKNLDIIPRVLKVLHEKYKLSNIRFHLTIPESCTLWKKIKRHVVQLGYDGLVINHGKCTQLELVDLYRSCSIYFFPSLLEVFSASIIEALLFNLTVVASDFPFNKDILQNAAIYFAPENEYDAAEKIFTIINNKNNIINTLNTNAKNILTLYQDYDSYFNNTLDVLKRVATTK